MGSSKKKTFPPPECPYCGKPAEAVDGMLVFPGREDLKDRGFWLCDPCDAFIERHMPTGQALGVMANVELRRARTDVHLAVDAVWQTVEPRVVGKRWVHSRLAEAIGVPPGQFHVMELDFDQCQMCIALCEDELTTRVQEMRRGKSNV